MFNQAKSQMSHVKCRISRSGFTLIEILVVFALVATLSALGFASFVSYSRKQTVLQAANNVKQAINLARFNALSSVKTKKKDQNNAPLCEGTLNAYKIEFCSSVGCSTYQNVIVCSVSKNLGGPVALPQNVEFTSEGIVSPENVCSSLVFDALTGSLSGSTFPCSIKIKGYNNVVKLIIDEKGYVSIE